MADPVQIASTQPEEVALSPDGLTLYSSGADGILRVYDITSGALIASWQVGTSLGGIDVSPDGAFLMVVDRSLACAYKVDTSTGHVDSYVYAPADYNSPFFDVAILSNGTALISDAYSAGGSPLKILDLATGQFSTGPNTESSAVLSTSADGSSVLFGDTNSSAGALYLYQTGTGIVAHTYTGGYNFGVQAISPSGDLIAKYDHQGILIYDSAMQLQTMLSQFVGGEVTDMTFDPTGQFLYVLDNWTNTIIELRVSDWKTVTTIPIDADVADWGGQIGSTLGGRLVMDPDGRYFSVFTNDGLVIVASPNAPPMTGTDAADTIHGLLFADAISGGAGDDVLYGGGGNDTITGGTGNNQLHGGAGDDQLIGGPGNDLLDGGDGLDTADYSNAAAAISIDLSVTAAQNTGGEGYDTLLSIENVQGSAFHDAITGDANANHLRGGAGNDILSGGDGDDELDGGAGDDSLNGGAGVDTASYLDASSSVHVDLTKTGQQDTGGAGLDTLSTVENVRGSGFDDQLTGNNAANILSGEAGNDALVAGGGDDVLDGGAGADSMSGGAGNDRYVVENAADAVLESAGQGTDTIQSSVSWTLGANIENLELAGGLPLDGTGNELNNTITGNDGNNTLYGLDGADRLYGSGGDDRVWGGNGDDRIDGGLGLDVLSGEAGNDTLIGNDGDDFLAGGAGNDVINGGLGFDTAWFTTATAGVHVDLTISGAQDTGEGTDTLISIEALGGSDFDDVLTGGAGYNYLQGNGGNDWLDGGSGSDLMEGGAGNDTFVIDNVDDFAEDYGGGIDTVLASVTYVMPYSYYGIENLTLTGSSSTNGTGNDVANVLKGNDGANVLSGLAGNDQLYGAGGNDMLNGGEGADKMVGGAGDDIYVLANTGDAAYENVGEGTDLVLASVTYALRANVENLTLTGTAGLTGKGNELDNVLTGNSGANALYGYAGNDTLNGGAGRDILDGGTGADTLSGGADNDVYVVDNASDVIVDNAGEGTDFVRSSVSYTLSSNVERIYLTGSASIDATGNAEQNLLVGNSGANVLSGMDNNDHLYGGAGNDTLDGGSGNDYLEGGAGRDLLVGSDGRDYFVFRDGDTGATASTADEIQDFAYGDRVGLSPMDANTNLSGNQSFSFVGTAAFSHIAGELRCEQVGGDTFVSGDTNGDGTADFMIKLDGMHTVTSGDFLF